MLYSNVFHDIGLDCLDAKERSSLLHNMKAKFNLGTDGVDEEDRNWHHLVRPVGKIRIRNTWLDRCGTCILCISLCLSLKLNPYC